MPTRPTIADAKSRRIPRKRFTWTREGDPIRYHGEWFRSRDARRCTGGEACRSNAKSIPMGTPYARLDVPGTAHSVNRGTVVYSTRSYCPSCTALIAPDALCPFTTQKAFTRAQKEMGARLYMAVLIYQDDSLTKALFETEANDIAQALFDRYGADPRKLITGEAIEAFVRQPRQKKRHNI